MGPFFVGASLSVIETSLKGLVRRKPEWCIEVDGVERSPARYRAMIIVNGDLGSDLPFAKDVPLGSGDFHMFALRDLGLLRLPGQFKHAWDASVLDNPNRWGFEPYRVVESLTLSPSGKAPFPVNVDGSTMVCTGSARFRIVDRIKLIARA
jgi:hypothetical protein